jgi:membrane-associated phospholipid phosphatase
VVDTLYLYSTSNYHSGVLSFVTDQYAALPSLHIGYALFLSLAVFLLTTNRLARVLAAVYPVIVLAAILITGNHYLLDAVAGAVVLAVAFVANYGIAPQSVPEAIMVYTRDTGE